MTEATQRPWIVDSSHAKDRVGVQIWAGDVIIADVIPDQHNNEYLLHADLILKAVNSHDVLVAALEAVQWDIAGTCASCGCDSTETHKTDCQLAAALEQVK